MYWLSCIGILALQYCYCYQYNNLKPALDIWVTSYGLSAYRFLGWGWKGQLSVNNCSYCFCENLMAIICVTLIAK